MRAGPAEPIASLDRMRNAVYACLSMALAGCSFVMSKPAQPPGRPKTCMSSNGPIVADALAVIAAALLDLTAATCKPHDGLAVDCFGPDLLAAGGTVAAVPFLASAIYGVIKPACPEDARPSLAPPRPTE